MTEWWLPYADSSKEKLFEHHVGHGFPPTFSFLKLQLGMNFPHRLMTG
jgi:hypothetical protein